jgi:hypothetical protein
MQIPCSERDAFWLLHKCQKHIDCLLDAISVLVQDWWEKKTTISPNMKDIVKKWIRVNLYEAHPTHYLQVSNVKATFLDNFLFGKNPR